MSWTSADLEHGKPFDHAIADFAFAYASQAEQDFADFLALIERGDIPVRYEG